ncbi:MAG: inositol monophosphatase family protein [Dehalococcoidia bacterium]|tara:strand:+ start:431 stop:1303 length:873 start_codon:yes stop_codon:yes gene_type:complete
MENYKEYENFCIRISKIAGDYVLNNFDGSFQIFSKDKKNNLVTEIDHNAQKIIIENIKKNYPNHLIVGEEDNIMTIKNTSEFIWVIDPIDGTTNFVNGIPNFAISIALLKNYEPIAGVIWIPWPNNEKSLIFSSSKNNGSRVGSLKLDLTENNISTLEEGSVTSYSSFSTLFGNKNRDIKPWNKIIKGEKRVIGTVAYEMALVAKGVIKFGLFGPASIWDFGAGLLIIKEAGGVIYFLDKNYNIQDKFYSFESLMKKNNSIDEKMIYEWTGQFLIGGPMIMNLKDSKKFV